MQKFKFKTLQDIRNFIFLSLCCDLYFLYGRDGKTLFIDFPQPISSDDVKILRPLFLCNDLHCHISKLIRNDKEIGRLKIIIL